MYRLNHSHSENTGLETNEKVLLYVFVIVFFVGMCRVLRSRHMESQIWKRLPLLTLVIPSYFGSTLYARCLWGVIWTPTISSTLDCINLKLFKVLDIHSKVSENTRFVKNLLYGYHGNCLIRWCFPLIVVKMSIKNRNFLNAPRNHKIEGVRIKLCMMIVLVLYFSKK